MRTLHYLNQYFSGIGGEDKANTPPEARPGAVGPGRALEQALGEDSRVIASLICGDNYASERPQEVAELAVRQARELQADLLIAGPCFEAGRYGIAAGAVCVAVQEGLGIPAIAGMSRENPGADLYRRDLYIVDSGSNLARMQEALANMARLGAKLVNREPLGLPSEEGYIPRGLLRTQTVDQSAARRLGEMLLAKLKDRPFQSEVPVQAVEAVPAPPAVKNLSIATVALVTDGGLVPRGNPDNLPRAFARVWGAYSIAPSGGLEAGAYEVAHGGYDNTYVQQDPHRLVPVDALRELEREGRIGRLHPEFLSTTGNVNPLENSRRIGREMAQRLKEAGVDSVILTST